jgi:hypothetical protein
MARMGRPIPGLFYPFNLTEPPKHSDLTQPPKPSDLIEPPNKRQRYDAISFLTVPALRQLTLSRHRFDFTQTIIICVGEEQKEFLVHTDVIINSSSRFLNKLLFNDWKEAHERRIRLPEQRPETLEMYIHWMYTNQLLVEPMPANPVCFQCVKLYVLGDSFSDAVFCEAVVEKLVDTTLGPARTLPSLPAINFAWKNISVDCPLRTVITELWSKVWSKQKINVVVDRLTQTLTAGYPPAFILSVWQGLLTNNPEFRDHTFSHKSDGEVKDNCMGYVKALRMKEQD